MISVFLQVRLDSTRLPRKALLDLGGRTVLERCLDALGGVRVDQRLVVTEPASADELRPLVEAAGWHLFVGSKDNVLERFVDAARATGTTTIVRATGDNPLVSARLANLALERHLTLEADFTALEVGPLGSGVEVAQAAAYEKALGSAPDAFEREHVSPFLYRRPDQFLVQRTPVPDVCRFPQARITLDTPEDRDYLRALWAAVYRGTPPEVEDLIPWLSQNPR